MRRRLPWEVVRTDYLNQPFAAMPANSPANPAMIVPPRISPSRAQRAWTAYHFNVSTELVALGARLFGDPRTGVLKPGAVSSSRRGNWKRFVQVLKQIEVTYDVRGQSPDELLGLLPVRDFGGWVGR